MVLQRVLSGSIITADSHPIPTKLKSNPSIISTNQHCAIIAGSAAGFIVLLLLGKVFYHCRCKNKKIQILTCINGAYAEGTSKSYVAHWGGYE